jgi:SAM-dependent methyltransferase
MRSPETTMPSGGSVRVDDDGVHVVSGFDEALSVEIGGHPVWAFVPSRDGRKEGSGARLVPWPDLLRRYLDGVAEIVVRRLDNAEPVFVDSVALGSGQGTVSVVNDRGVAVAVDKAHRITETFATTDAGSKVALVDAVEKALALLNESGHPAFLSFGCLLGAVRDGRLIGHDNDADISYLARAKHPVDIMLESMEVERRFVAAGWHTRRMSGADFKLLVPKPNGGHFGLDVFTAFYLEDTLYVMPNVMAALPPSALVPQSEVQLEGRTLPAPADPEALLEATYGPGWRVPDPTFKYNPPRHVQRLLSGLMRGERKHERYWEEFYATKADRVPTEPSAFARWVGERERATATSLVDVGSGTGRDSLWFADQGYTTLGCDYAGAGVHYGRRLAAERGLDAKFRRLNLYDIRHILAAGARIARDRKPNVVYARFLVHALEDEGRRNLWLFSRSALRSTLGRIYLEFRTEATEHEFGEHFRQFVQPEVVTAELASYGFTIEHCENRHGLAVHHKEDPRVCRIVARLEK